MSRATTIATADGAKAGAVVPNRDTDDVIQTQTNRQEAKIAKTPTEQLSSNAFCTNARPSRTRSDNVSSLLGVLGDLGSLAIQFWNTRVLGVLAVLAIVATSVTAEARRDRTVTGDVIKAARFLTTSRLAEAKTLLEDLEKRAADAVEVKWLKAELAFQSGDYAGAIKLLDKVPDSEVDGMVGQTRKLAQSTLAVTETFAEVKSPKGHFIIRYSPSSDDGVIADLAGEVLDKAWEVVGEDLGLKPADPIRVEILGAPKDLAKLSPLTEQDIETTGTIALSKYNKLMVVSPRATLFGYPWMDTLVHEYTHLVVSRIAYDAVPVWLQEGIARFEQSRWRMGPSVKLGATEQALLTTALKKGRLISLDEMHPSMAKLPSQDAAALAYAEVYTLVGWMHGKVGYAGLRTLLVDQKDGKSARRAVADALGMTWSNVDKEWRASLKGAGDAKARAGKPIKFAKGGVDSENVGLEQVNARARKFARLGGMLRVRGMKEAAAIEYEKALAVAPDPFVAGKLARTLVELDKHDRAIELATPLVTADGDDAVAAVTLGIARSARQEWAEAVAAYELALRVSPFDPQTRCGLADAYAEIGDSRAARERTACSQLKN